MEYRRRLSAEPSARPHSICIVDRRVGVQDSHTVFLCEALIIDNIVHCMS